MNACAGALLRQGIRKCHLEFWERMGWWVREDVAFFSRILSGSGNA